MFLARPVLCDSLIQNSSKKSDIIRTHMLCFGYRFCCYEAGPAQGSASRSSSGKIRISLRKAFSAESKYRLP